MGIVSNPGFCANCPVDRGECPVCGTFWVRAPGGPIGARYGIRPTDREAFEAWKAENGIEREEPCRCCGRPWTVTETVLLQSLPNVVSVGTSWPHRPYQRVR